MFESLFGRNNIFLGVDIGTSSIKIVEITISDNKPVLSNYGWAPLNQFIGKGNESLLEEEVVAEIIRKIISEAGMKTKDAYVSLPSFGGLITTIEMPSMEEKDLEQAVRFEAHKYIPTSLEEVVISWEKINEQDNQVQEKKNDRILLVAASKNRVLSCEKIIKQAGLKLKLLELESFPLISAVIGNDQGTFLVLDIGARVCNIILVEKGVIQVNRNIDAGGNSLTQTIAKSMGIDESRAEKMKTSEKNFFEATSSISFPALELIAEEAAHIVGDYRVKNSGRNVDQIVLSGGTSNLVGIEDYFTKKLKITTRKGNPLSRVSYSPGLKDAMAVRFSVSLGMALKGVDQYLEKNNKN